MVIDDLNAIAEKERAARKKIVIRCCMAAGCMSSGAQDVKEQLDKAVAAARKSDLAKGTLKLLDEAPRYAEGTGVRLMVKAAKDLAAIKKLALIKMAN